MCAYTNPRLLMILNRIHVQILYQQKRMCSFKIATAGQHVEILTGFTNIQTVGTAQG